MLRGSPRGDHRGLAQVLTWQGGESRAWKAGPELARDLVCEAEVVEDRGKVMCDIQMMLIRLDHPKGL